MSHDVMSGGSASFTLIGLSIFKHAELTKSLSLQLYKDIYKGGIRDCCWLIVLGSLPQITNSSTGNFGKKGGCKDRFLGCFEKLNKQIGSFHADHEMQREVTDL